MMNPVMQDLRKGFNAMNQVDSYWLEIVKMANELRSLLEDKPQRLRIGFQCLPGGILNAYREGDVSFDCAVQRLEEWKDRQIAKAAEAR